MDEGATVRVDREAQAVHDPVPCGSPEDTLGAGLLLSCLVEHTDGLD